jgi:hypothetical protein
MTPCPRSSRPARAGRRRAGLAARRADGQGSVEYLIVLALVGIGLTAGAQSPLARLLGAMADHHVRLTDAVSRP